MNVKSYVHMVNAEKWSYAIEKSRDWVTSPVTLVRFTGPEGKMAKQETPRLDGHAAWDDYRPGGTQRFLALDTLRGVAILMVVVGHFLPDRLVFGGIAHHVNSLGRGGVILFFLLSGYLIFRNVERQDTATFLSRRLFKIFPAYSVNVALIFALGYFNSAPPTGISSCSSPTCSWCRTYSARTCSTACLGHC